MKIVIAPAKTIKYQKHNHKTSPLLFPKETNKIKSFLQTLNPNQLKELMNISFKLSDQVYDYYHQNYTDYPAFYFYQGTVFKELELQKYTNSMWDYASNNIRILDAYYGIIQPLTGITPYRLDMTMNLPFDLYDFWKKPINNYFKNDELIISLASKEFNKMLDNPNLINIDFVEVLGDKYRRNSMYVKKARGMMLNYLILNQINTLEQIKNITIDDYQFNPKLSSKNNLVFIRNQKIKYNKK